MPTLVLSNKAVLFPLFGAGSFLSFGINFFTKLAKFSSKSIPTNKNSTDKKPTRTGDMIKGVYSSLKIHFPQIMSLLLHPRSGFSCHPLSKENDWEGMKLFTMWDVKKKLRKLLAIFWLFVLATFSIVNIC